MKNLTKKILSVLLTISLMSTMWSGINVFATGSVNVSIKSDKVDVTPASDVTITVAASNLASVTQGIIGYSLKISYDATKFEYVNDSISKLQGAALDADITANNVPSENVIYILYDDNYTGGNAHPIGEGNLFSLKFKAIASEGNSEFIIGGTSGSDDFVDNSVDDNLSAVSATYLAPNNSALVSIVTNKGLSVSLTSDMATTNPGDEVSLTGSFTDFTGITGGIISYSVKIYYDASLFEYLDDSASSLQGVDGDGLLNVFNNSNDGILNLLYEDLVRNDSTHPILSGNVFAAKFRALSEVNGVGAFSIQGSAAGNNFTDNSAQFPNWEVNNINTSNNTISVAIVNSYTVIYKNFDGSTIKSQVVNSGGEASPPSNPTRAGYTFTRWDKASTDIMADTVITAQYTINKFTVTYKDFNGTIIKTETVDYNTNATPPSNPARTGYTFTSWDKASTGIMADTVITAQYAINKFTVVFKNWDGTVLSTQNVNYATPAVAPSNPMRTGYTFTSWDKAFNNITSAITVNAVFTINSYNVTFNSMGGTAVAVKSVQYNTVVATPTKPTRTGFTFLGWYTSSAYTTLWNFTTSKVTATTTLYARWVATTATGLKAASAGYNSIKLTWTAVSGANNYEIYRSTSTAGTYVLVATIASTTSAYTNISLPTNTTYYYKVRGYALVGTVKTYSGYTAIASAKAIPATPTGLVATAATYNSTRLNWTAVAGANGYSVYRATSLTGTYSLLATVTTNTYTKTSLTPGTTYYYKVSAYRLVGTTKVYGAQCTAISKRVVPPTITSFTAVRASATSIKLTWGAISGASGYEIYRSTALSGTYTLLKAQTLLTYTNTVLKTGTTYYYKVRAYRMVGTTKIYGDFSTVKFAKP